MNKEEFEIALLDELSRVSFAAQLSGYKPSLDLEKDIRKVLEKVYEDNLKTAEFVLLCTAAGIVL